MHSVKILGERKASFVQFFGAKGNLKSKCKEGQPRMNCQLIGFLNICFLNFVFLPEQSR
jgi:hypothetical protein